MSIISRTARSCQGRGAHAFAQSPVTQPLRIAPGACATCALILACAGEVQGQSMRSTAIPAAVQNPSSGAPTQSELDSADTNPANWLTSNKGYLGYRYSKLDQINTGNIQTSDKFPRTN